MRGSFMQILQLALSSIQVPAYRQRKEIEGEGLSELMASIEANGLLQPIVVRTETVSSGFAGNSQQAYSLVAGHRRLSAIFLLAGMAQKYKFGDRLWSPEFIPCVNLGDLDQLAAEEAELEENVRRIDLTWDERARATARLSGLRSRRAQQGNRPQPSVGEIALEVRGSAEATARETTRREIILAPFLEVQAPHLKGKKSLDEAWKAHLREEERLKNIALGKEGGLTFGAHRHTRGVGTTHWYPRGPLVPCSQGAGSLVRLLRHRWVSLRKEVAYVCGLVGASYSHRELQAGWPPRALAPAWASAQVGTRPLRCERQPPSNPHLP